MALPALADPVAAKLKPLLPLPPPFCARLSSMRQAVAMLTAHGAAPPRGARVAGKPIEEYVLKYAASATLMEWMEAAAEESFAAMRARIRFGIAMAAMISMIATTIRSSISEKPFCLRMAVIALPEGCYRMMFRALSTLKSLHLKGQNQARVPLRSLVR